MCLATARVYQFYLLDLRTLVSVLARDRVESAYLTYECVRVWVVSKDTGVWTMDTEYVLGSARCYTSETYK